MIINRRFYKKYGPWALVTGASSGIGKSFAELLGEEGFNLVLTARRTDRLEKLASNLRRTHRIETRIITADLGKPAGIEAIEKGTEDLEIGLLVSNAGYATPGSFLKADPDTEASLIHLNVTAHMHLSHFFGQRMITRGQGGIILVSSTVAYQAVPLLANYNGAKSYVLNFGEVLHYEWRDKGVDVTVLAPGATASYENGKAWGGMDLEKMPVIWMKPAKVAESALDALGKKSTIIPGIVNQIMAFVMSRLVPRKTASQMFSRLMKDAIPAEMM